MKIFTRIHLLITLCGTIIYAQPNLKFEPNKIEFEDLFNRLQNVKFINDGDQPLTIDSITYRNTFYSVRFDRAWYYPFTIAPGDTMLMDCILSGYFFVTSADTSDTITVFHSNYTQQEELKVGINFYDDEGSIGNFSGNVSSGSQPVNNALVYFFYDGTYLLDTAHTDISGNFSKNLPEGNYLTAVQKESFYFKYFPDANDPFAASWIFLPKDSSRTINFSLDSVVSTNLSVSGTVRDFLSNYYLDKGVVVVRKGKHTPTKLGPANITDTANIESYTGIINSDGTYTINNILEPGYYFVQGYSDFYLPCYYTTGGLPTVLWQNADSILIDNSVSGTNITMKRDSSYGAGSVSGNIIISGNDASRGDTLAIPDVIVLARNLTNQELFYYSYPHYDGSFNINNLPYGNYDLIAQSIGYGDGLSGQIEIIPGTTSHSGVNITFQLSTTPDPGFLPSEVRLDPNYPNPFNPSTNISYYLPKAGHVALEVFNALGERIQILREGYSASGTFITIFDGRNLSSGVYFISLSGDDFRLVRKMMLVK